MFWQMLPLGTAWPFLVPAAPAPAPAVASAKSPVGHPDRGNRGQVKAARRAARRGRRR